MKHQRLLGALALLGATFIYGGCVAHARTGAYIGVEAPVVFVAPPPLVEIDSNVWVVEDYDYPVYYVDDAYWVYREDVWYRSDAPERGWARVQVDVVPVVVVNRRHQSYVHYHGAASARTRVGPMEPQMRPASRVEQDRHEPAHRAPPDRPAPPRASGRQHQPPSRVERRDERPRTDVHGQPDDQRHGGEAPHGQAQPRDQRPPDAARDDDGRSKNKVRKPSKRHPKK